MGKGKSVRSIGIMSIVLLGLGFLLILTSTHEEGVQLSSKQYSVELKPKSELRIEHKLNASAVYLRISCSMPCDIRVLVEVNGELLCLNCTNNVGLVKVVKSIRGTSSALIKIENYAYSERVVNILVDEIGSFYPYWRICIIGYFIWMIGFILMLVFIHNTVTLKKFNN